MWLLLEHGFAFDLADLVHGLLLLGSRESVDVIEDVRRFGYADRCSMVVGYGTTSVRSRRRAKGTSSRRTCKSGVH